MGIKRKTVNHKHRLILKTVVSWLKSEYRKEFPNLEEHPDNLDRAINWIVSKLIANVNPLVLDKLTILLCDKTVGMVHFVYGPQRVKFYECGCEYKGKE